MPIWGSSPKPATPSFFNAYPLAVLMNGLDRAVLVGTTMGGTPLVARIRL